MDKSKNLLILKNKIAQDANLPLKKTANNLVFGDGNPNAKLLFIGEAPGFFEDKSGKPFIGQAGKLLDRLLASISLKREDVYITNIVKFRPPNNRPPTPLEIKAFEEYLNKEIEIIDPKIIITLGRFSLNKFLPDQKISQIHGKPQQITYGSKEITLVPMYHPAAALRSPIVKKQLEDDFKKIFNSIRITQ